MKKIYLLLISIFTIGTLTTQAQCTAEFYQYTNGASTYFNDSSVYQSGGFPNQYWDFGDGNIGFGTNPTHNYAMSGTYLACLTISDTNTNCFDTICKIITVNLTQPCNADFQYTTNGLTVDFQDLSLGQGGLTYYWDFAGAVPTSTAQNPTVTFNSAGNYFFCLTIYDSLANCSDSICSTITVTANSQPCNASFNYFADSNNVVTFTNISTPSSGLNYLWDFGDGTASSSATNPVHQYTLPGSYGVTLTATGNGDTCTTTDTIFVNFCYAYYTSQVSSNGNVNFTNNSSASPFGVGWSWNFGDGSGASSFNASHTYTSSGTYTVILTLNDTINYCTSTYMDTVVVAIGSPNSCNASYTIAKDSSVAFGVILYNTSTNFASHYYSWNFGDGTTGSGRTPIHQYQSFGAYYVCLTITDTILNCTSTFCDTVGMDTLGNLKAGFGLTVQDPTVTSINETQNNLKALMLYPNPAVNQITIDLSQASQPVAYRVIDITGKEVRVESRSNKLERISLEGLEKGIYFLILNDGNTQEVKKFIKS